MHLIYGHNDSRNAFCQIPNGKHNVQKGSRWQWKHNHHNNYLSFVPLSLLLVGSFVSQFDRGKLTNENLNWMSKTYCRDHNLDHFIDFLHHESRETILR